MRKRKNTAQLRTELRNSVVGGWSLPRVGWREGETLGSKELHLDF